MKVGCMVSVMDIRINWNVDTKLHDDISKICCDIKKTNTYLPK